MVLCAQLTVSLDELPGQKWLPHKLSRNCGPLEHCTHSVFGGQRHSIRILYLTSSTIVAGHAVQYHKTPYYTSSLGAIRIDGGAQDPFRHRKKILRVRAEKLRNTAHLRSTIAACLRPPLIASRRFLQSC